MPQIMCQGQVRSSEDQTSPTSPELMGSWRVRGGVGCEWCETGGLGGGECGVGGYGIV